MTLSEPQQELELRKDSLFVPVGPTEVLHIRRFWTDPNGPVVLMIHGAVENGKIFYSDSDKGLASFLAKAGFDVYVGDLRGRGMSRPPISAASIHGQTECITEDIPAFVEAIRTRRGNSPQYWIGHSWGGVLLLSSFARFPNLRESVRGMIFFGTKRIVEVQNLEKWFKIDFVWNIYSRYLIWKYGYLPGRDRGLGSDSETYRSHLYSMMWVRSGAPWIDPGDGFDYGKAIVEAHLPPVLYLAGTEDRCLGHPSDVRRLMKETQSNVAEFRELPGYGHIDMLTSGSAVRSHFADVVKWMKSNT